MANPWFRMYSEWGTDPKVQSMSESMQRRLVMLFCLRCSDVTVTLCDDELAFHLRISPSELSKTKALFLSKGFIDEGWNLCNWEKRQYASDSSASRTRAYRERKRNVTVTSHVTERDALDTDTDTERARATSPNGLVVIASDDPQPGSKVKKAESCPYAAIVDLYHERLPTLPRVEKLTETRRGYLRQRWSEDLPTLEAWGNYFADVARSEFLTGKAQGRDGKPPFRATLEWLTRPGNFAKVAEGNYHR